MAHDAAAADGLVKAVVIDIGLDAGVVFRPDADAEGKLPTLFLLLARRR